MSVAGSAVTLATIPPGPSSIVITNAGAATLYVGSGTAATVASGAPVPASGVVGFAAVLVVVGDETVGDSLAGAL